MNPRDAGFALAALRLAPKQAAALAQRAPREAGGAIKALLDGTSKDDLQRYVEGLRENPGTAFARVHASWLAARLLEADQPVLEAVLRSLAPAQRQAVVPELKKFGRAAQVAEGGVSPLRLVLDAELVDRFRDTVFPGLGKPAATPKDAPAAWVVEASEPELMAVARECGLRVVARAFSRIGREDLARLCHGLPPQDSVRLVSTVVELNQSLDADALRKTQATHLRLLKTSGISQALFDDSGLAFVAAAAVASLEPAARLALQWRLPEELGRRLFELSAPGALPEASAIEAYRKELGEWLGELKTQGLVKARGG